MELASVLLIADCCGIGTGFFVRWYRHIFHGYRLKYLSRWCLDVRSFTDEVLGIDPIWKKCIFFSPTLDGSDSIIRAK